MTPRIGKLSLARDRFLAIQQLDLEFCTYQRVAIEWKAASVRATTSRDKKERRDSSLEASARQGEMHRTMERIDHTIFALNKLGMREFASGFAFKVAEFINDLIEVKKGV